MYISHHNKMLFLLAAITISMIGFACNRDVPAPLATNFSNLLPAPMNVRAQLGVGSVFLNWSYDADDRLKEFRVYRKDGIEGIFSPIIAIEDNSYADTLLVSGTEYYYRVAAVDRDGFEGLSSEEISITPAIYSIIIEGGAEATKNTTAALRITAPENTAFMMLANDSTFEFANWETFSSIRSWQFGAGDGLKTIYANFRDKDGYDTKEAVTAKIVLDTYAQILSIEHDGYNRILKAGDPLHIRMEATDLGGSAQAFIINADTLNNSKVQVANIKLYDNGTRGDQIAGDGIYEFDYFIDRGLEMPRAEVVGEFTDLLGNQALSTKAPTTFVLSQAPNAVILQEPANANQSTPALILRWTANNESDFVSYQVYRSTNFVVSQNSPLVVEISDSKTTRFVDTTVDPSTVYYYSVFVFDTAGNHSQSNIVSVKSPANKPPKPVVLSQAIGDSVALTLTWSPSTADDFANYQLFRSTTQSVDTSFAPIRIISDANTTIFRDFSVAANIDYFYQIFVSDEHGLMAGSNKVQGRLQ